ncbi:hypothetical protein [Archaeoglobus profundus]|uniref:Uncharacterized protein n=1 Tax=Archaeoglobus profundus (strain DSM 5631 / JCM 9629 / NBRC 100127 / Av18) TaxID=572546 RepID=D2RDB6_ARCPA|nr:hypothetical protein [Archaeoglobus profundus]ADB58110.1 hypothetical protein Arcpr_1051 [Archaeoglobus profundus DSM 5631]
MQVYERLKEILEELERINYVLRSKALERAIENIKIALHGEKVGSEGFEHSYIRHKLIEKIGGNVYIESGQTGLSKLGFRPDLVIIKDEEVIIAEIETDKGRALKKMRKVARLLKDLKSYPIIANRKVRVVFALSKWDERVLSFAESCGFEVLLFEGEDLRKP